MKDTLVIQAQHAIIQYSIFSKTELLWKDSQIFTNQTFANRTFAERLSPIRLLPIETFAYRTFTNQDFCLS